MPAWKPGDTAGLETCATRRRQLRAKQIRHKWPGYSQEWKKSGADSDSKTLIPGIRKYVYQLTRQLLAALCRTPLRGFNSTPKNEGRSRSNSRLIKVNQG
jgi:hypothetical protein